MASTMSRASRLIAALLALGAVAYTAWTLEVVLATGLDPAETYVSELAATDQPLGALFRTTDLIAGLLFLAAAVTALLQGDRGPRWTTAGWVGMAVFGAATAVDSRFPLSCAPIDDPGCAARERAGLVPFTHVAHTVSSSVAIGGALVALVALTVAARRYGRWAPVARFGPNLVAVELLASLWTLVAVAAVEVGRGPWFLGAGQRLQVLLIAVWTALLAYALAGRERAG